MIELSFVTERSIGSAAIRWFTHSDYSHVDIILPSGQRLGARSDHPVNGKTGVQIREFYYSDFVRDDRLRINAPVEHAGYRWLRGQVGKPYDISGLYRSFLLDDTDWRCDDRWWCSELGMAFLEHCGIKRCHIPVNRVAPNDLYIYAWAFSQ